MKGWQIFKHSVRMVFSNLDAALRVSLVIYAVYSVIQIYFQSKYGDFLAAAQSGANPLLVAPSGFFLTLFVTVIVTLTMTLWIAVSWHRYVLLEEAPEGWLPKWPGPVIWGYFSRSIVLGMVLIVVGIAISFPLGLVVAATGSRMLAGLTPILFLIAGTYVFYRLCPVLPAAALGQPVKMRAAWDATKGADNAIIVLVLLVLAASIAIQLPTMLGGNPNGLLSIVYSLVVNWVVMLVGVSVLTTFYGHYVESRPVD